MKHNFTIAVFFIFLCGCAIPKKVNLQGPVFSPDALAFLDAKGATRDEAIATLGLPIWESTNSCVLVYLSETATHWDGVTLEPTFFPGNSNSLIDSLIGSKLVRVNENDNKQWHILFIAYDERGLVKFRAVQKFNLYHSNLEDLCARYAKP